MLDWVRKGYKRLSCWEGWLRHPFLLVVRLYWGWQFFLTGKGKLTNIEKVTEFFKTLNIPHPRINAYMAGSVECFGGLFLLLGLATRVMTIPLIVTMGVAYLTADLDAVKSVFSDPDQFLKADPFHFLMASIVVMVFGSGSFSLDYLIARLSRKRI